MENFGWVRFWTKKLSPRLRAFIAAIFAICLAGCNDSDSTEAEQIRPVRTITVQTRVVSESVILTGHVKAEEEVTLAFRMDGQLIDRRGTVGASVDVGEVVARLDPRIAMNTSRAAEADLAAAKAALAQVDRRAAQQLQSAQAQVDAAQARLNSAQLQLSFTELRTEVAGIIIAKGAEPGEVVRAGQPIVQIARLGKKEATFDVPSRLMFLQGVSQSPPIDVSISENPNIRVVGYIREIGVQADPVTRSIPVKVSLPNAPDEMRIGATVTGGITISSPAMIEIPSTALTESRGDPALWVVNPSTQEVSLRRIQVVRYNSGSFIVSSGLRDGEKVVTAGVQTLRPDQKVKLLDGSK